MTGAGRRVEGASYAGASRDVLQSCLSSRAGSPPTVHGRHETGRRNARGGGRRQDPAALALEALAPLKPRVLSVSARGVPAWSILSSTSLTPPSCASALCAAAQVWSISAW
jgi:hypothetical protein